MRRPPRMLRQKWTRCVSRIMGEGSTPSAALVGEAWVVDGQVGLTCQVRLGLLERERVGECGVVRRPDHFHGLVDNYIAAVLLHAPSFADHEPLSHRGIVQSTFASSESVCPKC